MSLGGSKQGLRGILHQSIDYTSPSWLKTASKPVVATSVVERPVEKAAVDLDTLDLISQATTISAGNKIRPRLSKSSKKKKSKSKKSTKKKSKK